MSVLKMLVHYYPNNVIGTIIGISTVSCNFGDSFAKLSLSSFLLAIGRIEWQKMYYLAVGLGLFLMVPTIFLVPEGSATMKTNEKVVIEKDIEKVPEKPKVPLLAVNDSFISTFIRLMSCPRILLLILMCMAISVLREIIGSWSNIFLTNAKGLDMGGDMSGICIGLFPIFSGLGALFGGRLIDGVSKKNRTLVNLACMIGIMIPLIIISLICQDLITMEIETRRILCVILMCIAELFLGYLFITQRSGKLGRWYLSS